MKESLNTPFLQKFLILHSSPRIPQTSLSSTTFYLLYSFEPFIPNSPSQPPVIYDTCSNELTGDLPTTVSRFWTKTT